MEIDHMAKWKEYGRTAEGLRDWAKAIMNRPELRMGYCECVLKSAADRMEQLENELAATRVELSGADTVIKNLKTQ